MAMCATHCYLAALQWHDPLSRPSDWVTSSAWAMEPHNTQFLVSSLAKKTKIKQCKALHPHEPDSATLHVSSIFSKSSSVQNPAKANALHGQNAVQLNKALKCSLNKKLFLVVSLQTPWKNNSISSNTSNSKSSKPQWFTLMDRTCFQNKLRDHIC